MAKKQSAAMDYKAHNETYKVFIILCQAGIAASCAVLIGMAIFLL